MDLSSSFLGTSVTTKLQERISTPILQIGSDRFTRGDFAKCDCFNFLAAQNLSTILNKHLKVSSTKDVFDNVNPGEFALPRLGSFGLAVLGAAFEIKRLGGEHPLENWLKRHEMKVVTFHTLKQRDQQEAAQEKRDKKKRKAARRDQAHGLRVARFEGRSKAS